MTQQLNKFIQDIGWTMPQLNTFHKQFLAQARRFYHGHRGAVGALLVTGMPPMLVKSGIDGGVWGGTHRGGIPRLPGYAFTSGGPSEGNIATHVEGHAAAIIWQRGLTAAKLIVDREMCRVCDHNLSNALPPGATLVVISEQEGTSIMRSTHGN